MYMMSSVRWAFNTKTWHPCAEQWRSCLSSIQSDEVARISQFVFKHSAKSSAIGRVLLRRWACQTLSVPWKAVQFSRTDKGRPYVSSPAGVTADVNVSHQGDWVVLAGAAHARLGVDVMKLEYNRGTSTQEFFRLMKRQFTSEEWTTITESDDELAQLACFYRHWCLKESIVKALGIGIGFDLQKVSFQLKTASLCEGVVTRDTTVAIEGSLNLKWRFEETMLDADHCTAVAYLPQEAITPASGSSSLPVGLLQNAHARDCNAANANSSFNKLSFNEVIDEIQHVTDVTDQLVNEFMAKEEIACL